MSWPCHILVESHVSETIGFGHKRITEAFFGEGGRVFKKARVILGEIFLVEARTGYIRHGLFELLSPVMWQVRRYHRHRHMVRIYRIKIKIRA